MIQDLVFNLVTLLSGFLSSLVVNVALLGDAFVHLAEKVGAQLHLTRALPILVRVQVLHLLRPHLHLLHAHVDVLNLLILF